MVSPLMRGHHGHSRFEAGQANCKLRKQDQADARHAEDTWMLRRNCEWRPYEEQSAYA